VEEAAVAEGVEERAKMASGLLAAGVVLAAFIVWAYNSLVTLKNRCENQWSQIDIQLKRRNDLIPKLVEFVGNYASHERLTFENVTKARSLIMEAESLAKKAEASDIISKSLKSLFAVAENYPNLKANENFLALQKELRDTEDKIAYSRQFYNEVVLKYETRRQAFPTNVIANLFGFKKREYFRTAD
jgi:LemA protein